MAPQPEKDSENKTTVNTDIFGFGKMYEKIPLQKINALMAFALAAVLIIFTFFGVLFLRRSNHNDFPTDWDMRAITAVAIIIIAVCIINYIKKNK